MILIRHSGETGWRAPATTAYADERALQQLIAQSPNLIPGNVETPMAVARELAIPAIGYVDVVGVMPGGDITIVECKLKANPEIRRQVVGQVLAYAAGLWGMSYEAFDAAFTSVAGQPLAEQVRALSVGDWDEEAFRCAVADNLARGKFRLVIVVDAITDELKQIVLYLNKHTDSDLQVLALELGYIADNEVEILVPQSYGEESVQSKSTPAHSRWDESSLFAKLEASSTPAGLAAVREFYGWLKQRSAQLYWSSGSLAWVSAQFLIGGKPVSLVSIGEWPEKRGVVSVNFEYLRGLVPVGRLRRLADRLRTIPGVAEAYASLEAKDYRQRPNLPIDQILARSGAVQEIVAALDEFFTATDTTGEEAQSSRVVP
jgi:hypothetical protein